jgi:hypothetical protein
LANQFGDQGCKLIISTLCPPVFNRHVLTLDVTGISQTLAKSGEVLPVSFERCEVKKSDHRQRRLLRTRN